MVLFTGRQNGAKGRPTKGADSESRGGAGAATQKHGIKIVLNFFNKLF